jgi:hypothetical protein
MEVLLYFLFYNFPPKSLTVNYKTELRYITGAHGTQASRDPEDIRPNFRDRVQTSLPLPSTLYTP